VAARAVQGRAPREGHGADRAPRRPARTSPCSPRARRPPRCPT
jgi:hypothetical protein